MFSLVHSFFFFFFWVRLGRPPTSDIMGPFETQLNIGWFTLHDLIKQRIHHISTEIYSLFNDIVTCLAFLPNSCVPTHQTPAIQIIVLKHRTADKVNLPVKLSITLPTVTTKRVKLCLVGLKLYSYECVWITLENVFNFLVDDIKIYKPFFSLLYCELNDINSLLIKGEI